MHRTGHATDYVMVWLMHVDGWMDACMHACIGRSCGVGFVVECHMRNQHSSRVLSSLLVR